MNKLFAALLALTLTGWALTGCRAVQPSSSGFDRYVALGDSLTAGMQSGGLTAQMQRASFPVVLSQLAGSPITAPETRDPGCPPPQGQFKLSLSLCVRRDFFSNPGNLGVPGARVEDVYTRNAQNAPTVLQPLYGLILGPQDTQVGAARRLQPRFVTVWVGANEVLGATLDGHPDRATPPEQFEQNYAHLLDALAPLNAHVIVLTVPDVSTVPSLIPGPRLFALGLGDKSCAASPNRIAVRTLRRAPKPASCGAPYALTPDEIALAQRTVTAYNVSIRRLAQQHGDAVYDANELLKITTLRIYDPASSQPFGPDFSLDGVHPSSAGYAKVARGLAAFIDKTYGTRIRAGLPTSF